MARISYKVASSFFQISLSYDFARDGGVLGTVINTRLKLPYAGIIWYTVRQNFVDPASSGNNIFTFAAGGVGFDSFNNLQYAGNRFLATVANITPGDITITLGGAGNVTAGRFIYTMVGAYQQYG